MEREIYFCNLGKGTNKNGDNYYFIEYVKADGSFSIKRDYINAIEYTTIEKKVKGKELQKLTGILSADKYDRLYVHDIK